MIINGDGGYGLLAAYIGGTAAQVVPVFLVQRSAATWRRCCIHRVNRVNSRSECEATMTAQLFDAASA